MYGTYTAMINSNRLDSPSMAQSMLFLEESSG